jgi:type VI secretion system protein ImpL
MGKLIGIFKQAWLASLLGIAAVAALIYFLGPLLAFGGVRPFADELNRYIAIGVLFLLWALWQGWKVLHARKKNQQMLNQLVKPTEPKISAEELASKEEVGELAERLQDALQSLEKIRRTEGKAGDTYLYQLPWYIIIGPPGAGKTTLLANSSLNFPLSDKYGRDAMRGVGGTRNCDWWFTDDAILLDTAGRYTTQDSQQAVDQAAWLGFLELLKQYRGRQPVNGVLVAVSLADFLQQSPEARAQHAKAIRKRIQELHEHLGIRFPVYMLFTKADLVAGFMDFFDDLDREGREQVWGMSFPYVDDPEHSSVGQFAAEFGLLEERLQRQLVEKLERERSAERRRSLYLFPQQFSSLQEGLQDFLAQVYQPSRYEQTAMLRGVYFTSATQEGAPIDRIMASLASSFGVAPQQVSRFSMQGKSFFINRLLSGVVFNEAGLAGANLKLARKLQWAQSIAVVGAVVLTLLVGMVWAVSYLHNRSFIATYAQQVSQIGQEAAALRPGDKPEAYLSVLDKARQLTWSYRDGEAATPWYARFGLSQVKTLGEAMDDKYETLLKQGLTPYARQLLEQQINASLSDPARTEILFNALKNYLFLGGQAPEGTLVSGVQAIDWNNDGKPGDEADRNIARHMQVVLTVSRDPSINANLVDTARKALLETRADRPALDKLAYFQFKQESIEAARQYDFLIQQKKDLQDINATFGKVSNKLWTDNVSGLFTKAGYEKVFLPNYHTAAGRLAKESWVLGPGVERLGDPQQIAGAFERYYQADYIQAWNDFLQDIRPLPIRNVNDARAVFSGLTSNGGNILFRLMQEVSNETDFSPDSATKGIFGLSTADPIPPLTDVDKAFQSIQDWTDAARFQTIGRVIDEVYATLNQQDVFGQLENNSLTNALGKLKGEAQKLPQPINAILLKTVDAASGQVSEVIKQELLKQFSGALQEGVGSFCQQKLQGLYPLAGKNKAGVNLADFGEFFQRGGRVDQFRQQHMQAKLDPAVLNKINAQLAAADTVRQAFFSTGGLNVNFTVRLLQADPQFPSIELSIGSLSHVFSTVGDAQSYTWPNLGTQISAKAIPPPTPGGEPLPVTVTGDDWQLFRMVENNRFALPNLQAVFEISPATSPNPFQVANNELRKFKCPAL